MPDPPPEHTRLCHSSSVNISVSATERSSGPEDVVVVEGDLDAHTAPALRARLDAVIARAPRSFLYVDLVGVPFIDSTGIGTLVAAHMRLAEGGAGIRLVTTQPRVAKVLSLTGLDAVIPCFPTVAEARRA